MIRVYTDAAVKGNPGLAAIGIVTIEQGKQTMYKTILNQTMDNHQAELTAIYYALQQLKEQGRQQELIFLYSDSKFAITAIAKNYTKQVSYQLILQQVQLLKEEFPQLFMDWIPEKQNRGADQLARQALQQVEKR